MPTMLFPEKTGDAKVKRSWPTEKLAFDGWGEP